MKHRGREVEIPRAEAIPSRLPDLCFGHGAHPPNDAFGNACYLSDAANPTFNCFYKTWEEACAEAVKIGEVSGNAPYLRNKEPPIDEVLKLNHAPAYTP